MTLILGCQSAPWTGFPAASSRPELVWPPPPEQARVAWLMNIREHQDLFDTGGGFAAFLSLITGEPESGMSRPFALALHPDGGLLVTDPGAQCVHFFRWSTRDYIVLGGEKKPDMPSPVGIAGLPDGRILVADSRLNRILAFDRDGKELGVFADAQNFVRPAGIAFNPAANELYVCDVMSHQILVFDATGAMKRKLGGAGSGPAQFNFPTHIALTPEANLAVTDSMNFRIQILKPDGLFVSEAGRLGDAPGTFAKPKGVAIDTQGNIIAVESLHGAVQIFNQTGDLLLSIGQSGQAEAEFWLPSGLAFDPQQNLLFVADSYNSRVQVFRLFGAPSP